jgi:lysophospholipase
MSAIGAATRRWRRTCGGPIRADRVERIGFYAAAAMTLVTTSHNTVPEGAVSGVLKTDDGALLRYAQWDCGAATRGTVCLLQGRAEYVEKYFETVRELRSRGFAVVTFDWRWQGGSGRALPDAHKGYVESFRQYDSDLRTVMTELVLPNCRPPFIGLAHSMGAAIALRAAAADRRYFDSAVLTTPMIGLPFLGSSPVVRAAVRAMRARGLGKAYIPGGSRTLMDLRPFAGNRHTSDPERYARQAGIIAHEPPLGLGSPTIAWTDSALDAMKEFAGADYPRSLRERLLIVAGGRDTITSVAAGASFARRAAASYLEIAGARHEILMERDRHRRQFWAAFDSFVG